MTAIKSTDLTEREMAAVDRLVQATNAAQALIPTRFTIDARRAVIVALTRADGGLTIDERNRLVRYWEAR